MFKETIRKLTGFLLTLVSVFLISETSYATDLKIGIIPEHNVFEQIKKYNLIGDYIKGKTGINIKLFFLSRYGNVIESFNAEKMDGAFWGSFTGAMALKQLNIEFLARPVNFELVSTYNGYIFVHRYSIIKSAADMENTVIAFVDKSTTAGYLFPLAYLRKSGVRSIDNYFKRYYFTGSDAEAIYAVLEKEANIGCANNITFDSLALKDPRIKEDLVIIAKSPALPRGTLGMRRDLPLAVKEQLKRALLGMDKDPKGREALKGFGAERFVETAEGDYEPVFAIARDAGLDFKSYRYTNR